MEYIAEIAASLAVVLVGWLHMRQNDLERKLEGKVDVDHFEEVKEEMAKVIEILTELRIQNVKWQTIVDNRVNNKHERF